MADHDTMRDALQQMVDAFSPYAWGSIDSKRDALNAATAALAPTALDFFIDDVEAADIRDAARYRWLRANREEQAADGTIRDVYDENGSMLSHESLDAAIDAAMKGDQP